MRSLAILALLCGVAVARPGGGHSFSSHSSSHSYSSHSSSSHSYSSGGHYSSGGSSDDGAAAVAMLLVMLAVIAVFVLAGSSSQSDSYDTAYSAPPPPPSIGELPALLAADPDFSRTMFEDFVYRLYAELQRARGTPELARLMPYLGPDAQRTLSAPHERIEHVVVGTLHSAFRHLAPTWQVVVTYEANLATASGTHYVVEEWVYSRSEGVRTKPPATQLWPCPNCGAPWQAGDDPRTCAHCGQHITPGRFDWAIIDIAVLSSQDEGLTLTGTTPEVGNDYPTVRAPDAQAHLAALSADDPAVTWEAFQARVKLVYARLNEGWNASQLEPVRGLVTRSLQDYLRYWLDEYRRQGLVNHLDSAEVTTIELAKVDRDRWFDAITVRVCATGYDYTLRGAEVVGGLRTQHRPYTEYWTFVRSTARRGKITTDASCPNCGAPLAISDAGACTHCAAELENGSFDWVLSKIEQDDVYSG